MNIPNYSGVGIYCITIGTERYIGSSANVRKRLIQHNRDAQNHIEPAKLQAAFDSGAEAHVDILLQMDDNTTLWELLQAEQAAIEAHAPELNSQQVATWNPYEWIERQEMLIKRHRQEIKACKRSIADIKARYMTPLGGEKNGPK